MQKYIGQMIPAGIVFPNGVIQSETKHRDGPVIIHLIQRKITQSMQENIGQSGKTLDGFIIYYQILIVEDKIIFQGISVNCEYDNKDKKTGQHFHRLDIVWICKHVLEHRA